MLTTINGDNNNEQEQLDLTQENLTCHHLLFIQDVTQSIYDAEKNYCIAKSIKLRFKRVKLNGMIVAQKRLLSDNSSEEEELNIWIDDGTSVIKIILSGEILKRQGSELLVVSNNVTVFGQVKYINKEYVVICGGFQVQDNDVSEMYHWLQVIKGRPQSKKEKENNTKTIPDQHMFYTLSSNPSPNRLLNDQFLLESPIREGLNSQNVGFLWSPDHTFATSTPIRAVQTTIKQENKSLTLSPLRHAAAALVSSQQHMNLPPILSPLRAVSVAAAAAAPMVVQQFEDDDDDLFDDFGSGDLLALENNPLLVTAHNNDNDTPLPPLPLLQEQQVKRKFDLIG